MIIKNPKPSVPATGLTNIKDVTSLFIGVWSWLWFNANHMHNTCKFDIDKIYNFIKVASWWVVYVFLLLGSLNSTRMLLQWDYT